MRKQKQELAKQIPAVYIIPPAIMNSGAADGIDGCDEVYPRPCDWFKAHAMRFYFTDEQIIAAATPEFQNTNDQLTGVTGIYFLIKRGEIIYVGQSTNISYRVWEHHWMRPDGVAWVETPRRFLNDIEAFYIRRIIPCNNIKMPYYDAFDPLLPEELRVPKEPRTNPGFLPRRPLATPT